MLGTRRASTMLECISRQRVDGVSIKTKRETPQFQQDNTGSSNERVSWRRKRQCMRIRTTH